MGYQGDKVRLKIKYFVSCLFLLYCILPVFFRVSLACLGLLGQEGIQDQWYVHSNMYLFMLKVSLFVHVCMFHFIFNIHETSTT